MQWSMVRICFLVSKTSLKLPSMAISMMCVSRSKENKVYFGDVSKPKSRLTEDSIHISSLFSPASADFKLPVQY